MIKNIHRKRRLILTLAKNLLKKCTALDFDQDPSLLKEFNATEKEFLRTIREFNKSY